MLGARKIARKVCLFFGSADYSAEISSDLSWDALFYARSRIVNAAKEAEIDAMDGAWFDPHDDDGFLEELGRVVAMGFTVKVSYEAHHIPHIHRALAPSPEEVEHAQRVIAIAETDTVGIARLDGRMVNESIVRSARRVLAAGRHDALIALGCVIRGATPHFDYVAGEAARGLGALADEVTVPVVFGVLTTDTVEQALERAGTKAGNKGWDAALGAVELVDLFGQIG